MKRGPNPAWSVEEMERRRERGRKAFRVSVLKGHREPRRPQKLIRAFVDDLDQVRSFGHDWPTAIHTLLVAARCCFWRMTLTPWGEEWRPALPSDGCWHLPLPPPRKDFPARFKRRLVTEEERGQYGRATIARDRGVRLAELDDAELVERYLRQAADADAGRRWWETTETKKTTEGKPC